MSAAALPVRSAPAAAVSDATRLLPAIGLAAFVSASHLEAAIGALAPSPVLALALTAVALVAGGWAVRVARRPSRRALRAGALGAAGLVVVWAWTRAVGVPFSGAGRAPVGVLDALTAFDELLLAGFALAEVRERAALLGFAVISLSFMALAMGCEPPQLAPTSASASAGGAPPSFVCHLY